MGPHFHVVCSLGRYFLNGFSVVAQATFSMVGRCFLMVLGCMLVTCLRDIDFMKIVFWPQREHDPAGAGGLDFLILSTFVPISVLHIVFL